MHRRRFLALAATACAVPLAGCSSGDDADGSTPEDDAGDDRGSPPSDASEPGSRSTPVGDTVSDYESFFPVLYTPPSGTTRVELAFARSIESDVRAADFEVSNVRDSVTPRSVDTSEAAEGRIVLDVGTREIPRSFRRVSYADGALELADSGRPLAGRTLQIETTSSTFLESTAPDDDEQGRVPHGANVALYADVGSTNEPITVHRDYGSSSEQVRELQPGPGSRLGVLFTTALSSGADYEVAFEAEDGRTTRRFGTYDLGLTASLDSDSYGTDEPVTGTVSANAPGERLVELALYNSDGTEGRARVTLRDETTFDLGTVDAGDYKLIAKDLRTGILSQAVTTTVGR